MTAVVTILIPTFQRASKLVRAIESARAQEYGCILIHVFDNASQDQTSDVVNRFCSIDPRVKYHHHPSHLDIIANYNYALQTVQTQYFAFLADDDILMPKCIGYGVEGMESHPEVGFWGGRTAHIDEKTGRVIRGLNSSWTDGGIYSSNEACKRICSGDHLDFQGLLFRLSLVREHSICFDQKVRLPDVDFELQLAKFYAVGFTPAVTACMYAHSDSISSGLKSLDSYWPSLRLIESRFIQDNLLEPSAVLDCVYKMRRFSLETLWYIAARASVIGRNQDAARVIHIIGTSFESGFLPGLVRNSLYFGTKGRTLSKVMWFVHILFRCVTRPKSYLSRLFSFCLLAIRASLRGQPALTYINR